MTPTTAAVTPLKRAGKSRAGAEPLDIGCAHEDPQKAGRERRPERDRRAEQAESELGLAALAVGREEAHELGHENERAGRGLGKPEPIEHLSGA